MNNNLETENFQAVFVNTTELPKHENHICFYTRPDGGKRDKLICFEVYEAIYNHPDAPDYADVCLIKTRQIDLKGRIATDGGHLVLLEAVQNVCKDFYKFSSTGVNHENGL